MNRALADTVAALYVETGGTPQAFRDLLISIARTYRPAQEAAA